MCLALTGFSFWYKHLAFLIYDFDDQPLHHFLSFFISAQFSSTFLRNATFSGKCLQYSEFRGTAIFPRNSTFSGKCRDRIHASGFGIVKTETSGIPEFRLEEILEFAVPEPRLSYLNSLTSTNSIYSRKSRYQITRDLRLYSEKLYALYKIHEKISATGDDKTWNTAYKHLVNGLLDIMKVADIVVEHKNDIFNLQTFLSLPLNPAASKKILPIFVQIVNWKIKKVIIENDTGKEISLNKEAKRTFGRKIKVVCKDSKAMKKYLA